MHGSSILVVICGLDSQWMDKGEYYPGDIINYNGEQYACVKHGRFIHPVYEGHTRGSSFGKK